MKNDYYLQLPVKQKFYRYLGLVMTPVGLGRQEWWGYDRAWWLCNFIYDAVKIVAPLCILSQVVYIVENFETLSFDTWSTILVIMPVACENNVCVFSSRRSIYKKIMMEFMTKIHLQNYKDRNEYVTKTTRAILRPKHHPQHLRDYGTYNISMPLQICQVERFTRNAACFICTCILINCLAWYFSPIYINLQRMDDIRNMTATLQTTIYFWVPFEYRYNVVNWIIIHIANFYIVALAGAIIVIFKTIIYAFVFNLIGHIKILKYNIKTKFTNSLNDGDIKNELVEVIKYHNFIMKVFKEEQSAFGMTVSVNYLHNLICDSLLLYQVMLGDKRDLLTHGVMLWLQLGELILLSFVLEQIKRESDDISDLVYSIPWQNMSVSNQKIVLVLLVHVQPTMEFEAVGGMRAGVRPMISIIKSIFSYYVMLKQSM